MSSTSKWRDGTVAVVQYALGIVPPLTYLAFLALNEPGRWLRFLDDDAYYYFGIARHVVMGEGSTFAGLTETNGYQPLWLLVLLPVAAMFRGATPLVVATVVLQGLLWIGVVREGLRIGRRFGGDVCAVGGVAVLGVLAFGVRHLSFNGMESALLLFLLLVAVRLVFEADDEQDLRADVRLGLAFALICLTRLDAVPTAMALALVSLAQTSASPTPLARRVLALGVPSALALGVYAALNVAMFGVPLPVSGQAKTVGGPFFSGRAIREALEVKVLGRSTWLGAAMLVLTVVAVSVARSRPSPQRGRLLKLMAALLAGQVVFVGYLAVFTSYGMLSWYHYHTALLLFLASLVVFDAALHTARRPAQPAIVLFAATVLAGQAAGAFLARAHSQDGGVAAAKFVKEHLPESSVLAMGDRAGQFGYYSDQQLLHLEGLTADASYVEQLSAGKSVDRMIMEGVDYYARYGGGDLFHPVGWGCWEVGEPSVRDDPLFTVVACEADLVYRRSDSDDQQFLIWRFKPELQDAD